VAYHPVLYQQYNREEPYRAVPIFYLQRGHGDAMADVLAPPTPAVAEGLGTTKWVYFGHPLILGEQLAALNMADLLIQWTPGRGGWAGPAIYLRLRHPLTPVADPDVVQAPSFYGRPMALASNGLVISEDMSNRFLSVIPPGAQSQWHRDMPWILGIPAVHEQFVFPGAGGPGAIGAIMAFDTGTGEVGWTFPTSRLAVDAVSPVSGPGKSVGGTNGEAMVRVPDAAAQPAISRSQPPVGPRGQTVRDPLGARPGTATRSYYWSYAPMVNGPAVLSNLPTGWCTNPGLAISGGRVYGIAKVRALPTVVALDEQTGTPVWQQPLPLRAVVNSVAASKDHLFVSMEDRVLAFKLDDGKLEWARLMPVGGALELSKGLVFLSTNDTAHAFAPAERTYSLAVDSSYASDYPPDRPSAPAPARREEAPAPTPAGTEPEALAPVPARRPLADATVLRLRWPAAPQELVRRAKERHETAGRLPMLMEMDWTHVPGQAAIAARQEWNPERVAALAAACAELVTTAHPEHLNVAPEVNAYLARYPDQTEAVQAMIAATRSAVEKASPKTRVSISLNVEVLRGLYGNGRYRPLGKLVSSKEQSNVAVSSLVGLVDEVGLTSRPQSAFGKAEEIPGDYLLGIRAMFAQKPVLITAIDARMDSDDKVVALEQALFVKRLLQLCYWLDAEMVAYPNLAAESKADCSALMAEEKARPALAPWAEALGWKKVQKLTLARQNEGEEERGNGSP
jgi:outer membrane protein assembly factor BamB